MKVAGFFEGVGGIPAKVNPHEPTTLASGAKNGP